MKINAKNIDDLADDQGIVAGEVERQEGVNEDDEKLANLQGGQVPASRGLILSPWLGGRIQCPNPKSSYGS